VVASVGYNARNWPEGAKPADVKLGVVITDLCVFDFNGPDHAAQVLSLHPGVTFEQVQDATGFPLLRAEGMTTTAAPTEEQAGRRDPLRLPDDRAGCRVVGRDQYRDLDQA
jgi:glutaconate CoA-transferase subunit B